MRISRSLAFLAAGAALAGATACQDDLTRPEATRVSMVLTDAPGTIEHLWVDFSRIFLVSEGGEEVPLVSEPTGTIDITALAGQSPRTLAMNVVVPSDDYTDIRFEITGAALETEEGEVLTYGTISLPGGRTSSGSLGCTPCDQGAVAAELPRVPSQSVGIELAGGNVLFIIDFDVPLSIEPPPPGGQTWSLDPRLQTSGGHTLLHITGDVNLAEGVTVPECPSGTPRDLGSFIPLARAVTYRDSENDPLVRSGETDAGAGTFVLDFLQADHYELDYVQQVVVGQDRMLVFDATPLPGRAEPEAGVQEFEAQYTIESVTCEPR